MRIFILLTSLILIQNCRIYPGLDNRTSIPINLEYLMFSIFKGRILYLNYHYLGRLFEAEKINKINSIQPNNPTDNKDKDIRNLEDFIDVIKETPSSVCPEIAEFKLALLTEVDDWRSVNHSMSDKTWKYILPQQIVRNIFLKPDFNVENPNLPEKMKNFIKQYKYNRTQYLKDLKVEEGNPTEIDDTLEKKKGTIDPYEEDYKNYDSNVSFVFKYDFNDEQRSFYRKKDYQKNTLYFKEYQESCSRRKNIIKGKDISQENNRIDKAMSNNLFYKKSLYRRNLKATNGNWNTYLLTSFNWINDLCFNINFESYNSYKIYILKLDHMYKDFIDDDLIWKRRESIFQKYEDFFK